MQTPVTPLAGPCNRCISFPTPLCDDLVIWSPGGFPSVGYPRTPASCFFGGVLDPALGREEGGFRPILSPQRGGLFVCCFEGECVSTKRDLDTPPPAGPQKRSRHQGGGLDVFYLNEHKGSKSLFIPHFEDSTILCVGGTDQYPSSHPQTTLTALGMPPKQRSPSRKHVPPPPTRGANGGVATSNEPFGP